MKFNDEHIAQLDAIVETKARDATGDLVLSTNGWVGSACRSWAESVSGLPQLGLPVARQNRVDLRELVQSGTLTDDEVHLAVMAWGGQRRDHGRDTWSSIAELRPVIREIREGRCDRRAGYERFHSLTTVEAERVKGMGPAYYTKLLFFLPRETPGLIMDQWTAKSMQLLVARKGPAPVIALSHAGFVTRDNTVGVYDQFCEFIAALGARYGVSDGNAEELIFAGSKQTWRAYVKAQWSRNT